MQPLEQAASLIQAIKFWAEDAGSVLIKSEIVQKYEMTEADIITLSIQLGIQTCTRLKSDCFGQA